MFRRASARESATLDRSASSLASSIAVASLDHSKCRCGFRLRVRRRRHPPYFTKLGRLFDQGGRGHPPVRMPRFWPERSKRPPGSRAIFPWHEAQGRNVRDPKQCRTRRDLDARVLRCADQSDDRGLWPAAGDRGQRRPDAGIYRLTTPPPSANRCRRVSPCPAFGALPAACALPGGGWERHPGQAGTDRAFLRGVRSPSASTRTNARTATIGESSPAPPADRPGSRSAGAARMLPLHAERTSARRTR